MSDSGASGASHMYPDEETTSYMIEIPSEDWMEWKKTVPRTLPLYRRVHELIRADTVDRDSLDGGDLRLISMKFQRIVRRAKDARSAMDRGDNSRAEEEIDAIEEIATGYLD